MKKTVQTLVVIFAILILAGPFGVAFLFEQNLRSHIDDINEYPGYKASILSYESDWLGSQAKVEVGFDAEVLLAGQDISVQQRQVMVDYLQSLVFDVTTFFGPILVNKGHSLGWLESVATLNSDRNPPARELLEKVNLNSLLSFQQKMDLLGELKFIITSPGFRLTESVPKPSRFSYGGFDISGSYNLLSNALTYQGKMPVSSLEDSENTLSVGPVTLSADLEYLSSNVQLGTAKFVIADITASLLGDVAQQFALQNLTLNYHANRDSDDTFKMSVDYLIDMLSFDSTVLKELNFSVAIERLGFDAIDRYIELLKYHQQLGGRVDQIPADVVVEMGETFLKYSPVISIENSGFKMNGEELFGRARVEVDGSDPQKLKNPMLMMSAVDVEAEVKFSENIAVLLASDSIAGALRQTTEGSLLSDDELTAMAAEQVRSLLAQQAQQGFLVKSLSNYQGSFVLREGAMSLNGSSFPAIR